MKEREREMAVEIDRLRDLDPPREATDDDYSRPRAPRDPSQVYSVRIPASRIEQLRRVAQDRGIAPTTLIRHWVIERLDDAARPADTGLNLVIDRDLLSRASAVSGWEEVLATLSRTESMALRIDA